MTEIVPILILRMAVDSYFWHISETRQHIHSNFFQTFSEKQCAYIELLNTKIGEEMTKIVPILILRMAVDSYFWHISETRQRIHSIFFQTFSDKQCAYIELLNAKIGEEMTKIVPILILRMAVDSYFWHISEARQHIHLIFFGTFSER